MLRLDFSDYSDAYKVKGIITVEAVNDNKNKIKN